MEHVISRDGTLIAYERSGTGSPLVLVHGTAIDHRQWTHLIPRLGRYFTVYAVDRRGRGQSGDEEPYAIRREFEDVVAVVESIPETVGLLGHSFGALCSLEAALQTGRIHKLALYEPPIYTDFALTYPEDILGRVEAHIEDGDAERALLLSYETAQVPQAELDMLRSLPSWQGRISGVRAMPREFISAREYVFDAGRFRDLTTPTLLLVGGESPPFYRAAVEELHTSLPNNRVAVLAGQQHEAMETAPELFLREVIDFFR
ncbi:alpha/beta fold hydrolase [Agromyces bauzanensis]